MSLVLFFKLVIIIALIFYFFDIPKYFPQNRHRRNSRSNNSGGLGTKFRQFQENIKCAPLRNKILKRVDRATADRLINAMKYKHPGKGESWYLEKVIYDLERGR